MPQNKRWSAQESIPQELQADWHTLMREQSGVVSLEQLRRCGHTAHAIKANIVAGRWQRVLPRVYATFTGPLTRDAQLRAALLYGGFHAVLSHRTAAEQWGMLPVESGPIEITVPYTSSAVSQPPLARVHRSRAIRYTAAPTDPPRTRRTDTIIDLAVAAEDAVSARYVVVDLVARLPVSIRQMAECVELRPPMRYRNAIRNALELLRDGMMSALEVEYHQRVELAHGIPEGLRQTPFEVDGKLLWEDVTYDPAGAPLTVRLDGRKDHATAGIAFRDRRRDNAAELAGRSRLTYGWHDVHTDPCGVAAEVRTVLSRAGVRLNSASNGCPGCSSPRTTAA